MVDFFPWIPNEHEQSFPIIPEPELYRFSHNLKVTQFIVPIMQKHKTSNGKVKFTFVPVKLNIKEQAHYIAQSAKSFCEYK